MSQCLQDLLWIAAERWPARTAVVDNGESTTYQGLALRSKALALQLMAAGIKSGDLVILLLPKSIDAIISQFAVMTIRAVYSPFDVESWPTERFFSIVAMCNPRLILTTRDVWSAITTGQPSQVLAPVALNSILFLDDLASTQPNDDRLKLSSPKADDLAYVLYTSGSTGTPKGVAITHRNARAFVDWAVSYMEVADGSRFSSHASLGFDLSVFDVYACASVGGELHLINRKALRNPRLLVEWIERQRIEIWYSVPSVWISILRYTNCSPHQLATLRRVLFAGEPFNTRYLNKLISMCSSAQFYNLYGPTETNVCTAYRITESHLDDPFPPIGYACAHSDVKVVDADLSEVPVGEVGELVVCGPTVCAGYYQDSEATTKSFIVSPFSEHLGKIIYRTGDLVRMLPGALLEYVGRADSMIKHNGYRIEPAEIVRAMQSIDGIGEVVIELFDDLQNGRALGALVTPSQILDPGTSMPMSSIKLRSEIARKLPEYMIPDVILFVNNLPLGPNGKLDRHASLQMMRSGQAEVT